MSDRHASMPGRFFRWFCEAPFQRLPPQFGSPVPPDLQRFEAEAELAQCQGLGGVADRATPPHLKTHPARLDGSLERQ